MKVVIRHLLNGLYRRQNGTWTKDWQQAEYFGSSIRCIDFCAAQNLEDYEVVLKHPDDEARDIVVYTRRSEHADPRLHIFSSPNLRA